MSKRDELMKGLPNVRESMGDFGAVRGAPPVGPRATPAHLVGVVRSRDVSQIALDRIERDPTQPRDDFDPDGLDRLAQSLRQRGQLQPIRVRWDATRERYIILCGERRWRAAQQAGLESLACVVVEGDLSPQERLAVQLVENALREDLRPVEQARAYSALMEAQGWSARQLAAELSIHHAQVVRALSLLEQPEAIRALVEQGTLPPATAYELSKVKDEAERETLAARVVAEGLSRSETIEASRQSAGRTKKQSAKGGNKAKTKARKLTSRVFRTPAGKVTVELKKGSGLEAMLALVAEVTEAIRAEVNGSAGLASEHPDPISSETVEAEPRASAA